MLDYHGEGPRVLTFDTECRPLSYMGSDYTTGEVTAIAWAWNDTPEIIHSFVLGIRCQHVVDDPTNGGEKLCDRYHFGDSPQDMLGAFWDAFNAADLVTGHYIRGFDLPVVNGAMFDHLYATLPDKLTSDTKLDLLKTKYISASQENLAAALGLVHPKVSMNQQKWREANRLTIPGLDLTRERVEGDVRQHMELRNTLIDLEWLGPPKRWTPMPGGGSTKYRP